MRYDNELNITLKDLIGLVILIASVLTIYYTSVNQIEKNKENINEIKQELNEVDMKVLETELSYIRRDVDKIDIKMDRVLDKLLMEKGD